MNSDRLIQRKKDFKKGIDTDECRERRGNEAVRIRKDKRTDRLEKKRCEKIIVGSDLPPLFDDVSNLVNPTKNDILKKEVENIYSKDPVVALLGLNYFRRFSTIDIKYTEVLFDLNITNKLVEYLTYNNYPEHQYEAAWILTNMIAGKSEIAQAIIDNSMIGPNLLKLFRETKNIKLRHQVIWCLGNIAGEDKKYRNIIIERGGLEILLHILDGEIKYEKRDIELLRTQIWALSNLLRNNNASFSQLIRAIPVIQKVLTQCQDNEVTLDALWSLYYLSQNSKNSEELKVFVNMGLITPDFLSLLEHKAYCTPVLKLVGNLVAGTDDTTQAVLNSRFLGYIHLLLESWNSATLKETCWILSNIAAGTQEQAKMMIDTKILPKVMYIMKMGSWNVKKECIYILSNIAGSKKYEHVEYIFNLGAIKALCDTMSVARECPKTIKTVLNAIYNILDTGKDGIKFSDYINQVEEYGLDLIEDLQNHPNQQIYEKAVSIIDNFFGEERMEMDMEIDPNTRFSF